MKLSRKLLAVLLSAILVLTMAVPAFAADPADGETYTAYKIFDATIVTNEDDEITAASYSIANGSEWLSVVQNYNDVTLTPSADSTRYLVEAGEDFDATVFAAYLANNVNGKTSADSDVAANGSVTLDLDEDGYYLITSSLGSICQLVTGGSITIVEKNEAPTVDKEINTNDAYAQIGDVIPFTITITDGTGTNKAITLHDQMSESLTFNNDIEVKVNDTAVDEQNYEVKNPADTGDTFTITFTAEYIDSLGVGDKIVVTYTATLNEKAVTDVDPITNKASIDYSNQDTTSEKKVEIKTNSFAVLKYAAGDTNKANLAGATFQLKQGDTVIKLVKNTDTEYRVAMPNENGAVETFTTVDSGNIVIKGVDSDKTYTLVETVAPDGYNLLTEGKSVTPLADNTTEVEVENSTGTTLPTTGGMGTTVLYILGSIMVIGAGIILVVRRRMSVR